MFSPVHSSGRSVGGGRGGVNPRYAAGAPYWSLSQWAKLKVKNAVTRLPDYVAERLPVPWRWSADFTWAWLRRFHAPGAAVVAATPTFAAELAARGFHHVKLWTRGVDANLFRPRSGAALELPRPIFLAVGRVAVEKNLEAFLKLDLPGTKVVVGDGPARHNCRAGIRMRSSLGPGAGKHWRKSMQAPTCSSSPAALIPSASYCWKRWRAACRWPLSP